MAFFAAVMVERTWAISAQAYRPRYLTATRQAELEPDMLLKCSLEGDGLAQQ